MDNSTGKLHESLWSVHCDHAQDFYTYYNVYNLVNACVFECLSSIRQVYEYPVKAKLQNPHPQINRFWKAKRNRFNEMRSAQKHANATAAAGS